MSRSYPNRKLALDLRSSGLESRELLAALPTSSLVGMIRNPAAYFRNSAGIGVQPAQPQMGQGFSTIVSPNVSRTKSELFNRDRFVTRSTIASPTVEVATVRSGDPLFGYQFTLDNSQSTYAFDLTQSGKAFQAGVNLSATDIPLGAMLQMEVLSPLMYWNGSGTTAFSPVRGNLQMNLEAFGQNLRIGARTDQSPTPQGGIIRQNLNVAVSDALKIDRQIVASLGSGGSQNQFATNGGPAGVYAFTALWSVQGADGVRDSAPVTFVFRMGNVSDRALTQAIAYYDSPRSKPDAVVAVQTEFIETDGYSDNFLRIYVQYSSPVTAQGRSPQLPVYFGNTLRYATLEPKVNSSNVQTLQFVYRPTQQDIAAGNFRIGSSIRLQSRSQLVSSGGSPVILSLTETTTSSIPVDLVSQYVVISGDITKNTTFKQGSTYVIAGEVHVRPGVTLTIEDGVTVLIRNGRIRGQLLTCPALIFDSGSRLVAKTVYFKSCDVLNVEQAYADNGGVFFLGTYRNASKDGVTVDTSKTRGRASSFTADKIVVSYLGRTDPRGGDGNDNKFDDIDGISILGMGQTEWKVKSVVSEYSGDDGFDVTNSSITIDSLIVTYPTEDGMNISSSTVNINKQLSIVMTTSRAPDRELFDLEVDDGPSYINISRLAAVDVRGYWGNIYDEVELSSPDMPKPPKYNRENQWYEFIGVLRKGPARIFSITAD